MTDRKALINRLNRAVGQIEAIKKRLANDKDVDCVEIIQLLKSAQGALKKFGEAYVSQDLECCIDKDLSQREMEKKVKQIISSVFEI